MRRVSFPARRLATAPRPSRATRTSAGLAYAVDPSGGIPGVFRIGASSLLADIERQIEHAVTGRYAALSHHATA